MDYQTQKSLMKQSKRESIYDSTRSFERKTNALFKIRKHEVRMNQLYNDSLQRNFDKNITKRDINMYKEVSNLC